MVKSFAAILTTNKTNQETVPTVELLPQVYAARAGYLICIRRIK